MSRTFEEALTFVLVIIPILAFLAVISYFFWTQLSSETDVSFLLIMMIMGLAVSLEILIMFIYVLIGIRNRLEEGNQIQLAQTMVDLEKISKSPTSKMLIEDTLKKML